LIGGGGGGGGGAPFFGFFRPATRRAKPARSEMVMARHATDDWSSINQTD